MQRFLRFALCLAATLSNTYGYKFLVYSPSIGKGHMFFMGKIADILVKGGHEVVLYQPKFNDEYTVSGTKLARVIQRERDFEVSLDFLNLEKDAWRENMGGMNDNNHKLMETITKMFTSMRNSCERQLSDHDLIERLKSEKFDLAIGESMDACFYGIVRRVGIPKYISAFSTHLYVGAASILGLPMLPSFIPGFIEVRPNMTYWDRARNLMMNVLFDYTGRPIFVDPIEKVVKAHVGENFNTEESIAQSSYYFVNSEEHVAYPRPVTHKIIYVGGMGMPRTGHLEEKFERIMQSSKEGVVLVSFGSLSKSMFMPDASKKAFVEAFAQFPNVTFLWKYEQPEDGIAEGHSNIVLVDWVPQIEVLGHQRLLAFITHAGMNSISEAVYKGIPMICIPLFGDQHRNAMMVESRNLAVMVDKNQVNARTLEAAIRRVLYDDKRIAQNARDISHMISKKPLSPDERVLRYTEFAAEFDVAGNLDMYGRRLNFFQYYSLDVILPIIVLSVFSLALLVMTLSWLSRVVLFCCRKLKHEKSE